MKSVLIVERNEVLMDQMISLVKEADVDIQIRAVRTDGEAYQYAMKGNVSLFIVDVVLTTRFSQDASGINFAAQMRMVERYRHTPIIMMSMLEDIEMYAYKDLHCYTYLEKPFDKRYVIKVIREALDAPVSYKKKSPVYFRREDVLIKRDAADIVYIENSKKGLTIHFKDEDLEMDYLPSGKLLDALKYEKLIRCGRHMMVNKDYIDSFDLINKYVILKDDLGTIDMGKSYRQKFLREICRE